MPGVHCVEPRAKYADTVCLAAKPRAQARRAQLTSAAPLSAVAVLNYELPKYTRATETQRTGACPSLSPRRRGAGRPGISLLCVCAPQPRYWWSLSICPPPSYFIKESRHASAVRARPFQCLIYIRTYVACTVGNHSPMRPLKCTYSTSRRSLLRTFTSSLAHANGKPTGLLLRTAALSYRCRPPTLGRSLLGAFGLWPAFITLDDV